jgi:hypothetical protein
MVGTRLHRSHRYAEVGRDLWTDQTLEMEQRHHLAVGGGESAQELDHEPPVGDLLSGIGFEVRAIPVDDGEAGGRQ